MMMESTYNSTRTAFSDSNDIISNGSSSICNTNETLSVSSGQSNATELQSLRRLAKSIDSIFDSNGLDFYSDAKIVVSDCREVCVHRCVLSARSPFFKNLFTGSGSGDVKDMEEDVKKVRFELKELLRDFNVGFDAFAGVLGFIYGGKVKPLPEGICVCVDNDDCDHIACRPAIDYLVEVLYASCVFEISELFHLYQTHLLEILDKVETNDMLVILSVAILCGRHCERLVERCVEIIVKSDVDIVTLEKALPPHIGKQIMDIRLELGLYNPEIDVFPDKHVKRIHRALDSDDVELLRMLLTEGRTTLDDAYALHYAVAYCDAKTTKELLDLGLADVNRANSRGYTVLHIAAMRQEPAIIVSLLTKGARATDLTLDGRKALQISKRLTKAIDYHKTIERGEASPKNRLCIEILEEAERTDPSLSEASVSLALAGEDLRMKLYYFENRVLLARKLFPMQAQVAMDIAQVDGTYEFPLESFENMNLTGARRSTVDLNEAPFRIQPEHLARLKALSRTVELGKRFFPRCSEVLNQIMDVDDFSQLASVQNPDGTEDRVLKKRRYKELLEQITQAFTADNEELSNKSTITTSSSSSSSTSSVAMMRSNNSRLISRTRKWAIIWFVFCLCLICCLCSYNFL